MRIRISWIRKYGLFFAGALRKKGGFVNMDGLAQMVAKTEANLIEKQDGVALLIASSSSV